MSSWLSQGCPFARIQLNKPNAALQQSPRDQGLAGEHAVAIHLADMRGFFGRVESVGRVHLHAVREFKRLDARFKLRVFLSLCGMFGVQVVQ